MSAGAGVSKSSDFPPTALDFDAAVPAPLSPIRTAHDSFLTHVPRLLGALAISEDAELSHKKRVQVRGAIFSTDVPSVRFSAEYRGGKLDRVRIMTVSPTDDDLAAVPEKFGGTGLMAADDEDGGAEAAPPPAKRARSKSVPKQESLMDVLAKASELARAENREALMHAIDALLKSF